LWLDAHFHIRFIEAETEAESGADAMVVAVSLFGFIKDIFLKK